MKSLRNDFCPLFMLSSKNNNTFRIILPTKITRVFGTKEVKKQLFFWQSTCQKSNFLGSTCSDIYSWKSCKHLIISILEEDQIHAKKILFMKLSFFFSEKKKSRTDILSQKSKEWLPSLYLWCYQKRVTLSRSYFLPKI